MEKTKKRVGNSTFRILLSGILILAQIVAFIFLLNWLGNSFAWVAAVFEIAAVIVVLLIYADDKSFSLKNPWIIFILVAPAAGMIMYILFGSSGSTRLIRKRFVSIDGAYAPLLTQDKETEKRLRETDSGIANQCAYINAFGGYPVYDDTETEFYPEAADAFNAQIEELKNAKKFIFMEYHAIEEAESFKRLEEVLQDRAANGVEVRILYDDVGSAGYINLGFIGRMKKIGIECRVFNAVGPFLNIFMNNRDHRKITVIDGATGFTGGYNLADEYFGVTHPYGKWKDTGIKLVGGAVKSLTCMFLELWNSVNSTDGDIEKYIVCDKTEILRGESFVQPYGDSPLDDEPVGENVYMNITKNAKEYVYFMTPYLIITDEMIRELIGAAKRGVDVRIVTPGIPDKKAVYRVTRSYYHVLAKGGVKIYEYTPGFCHAKQCVSDGSACVVGTINLDYRSLYHHFENGVFIYDRKTASAVKNDFDSVFYLSKEVSDEYANRKHNFSWLIQCVLRLFAPLL